MLEKQLIAVQQKRQTGGKKKHKQQHTNHLTSSERANTHNQKPTPHLLPMTNNSPPCAHNTQKKNKNKKTTKNKQTKQRQRQKNKSSTSIYF
jgi:hypothetical protein